MKSLIRPILTIIPFIGLAQTGPAGVGSSDGTSNLDLWLKADIGVTTTGSTVVGWADQSGNSHNVTKIGGSPQTGNYINGYSTISLNGSNHFQSAVSTNSSDGASVYVAATITGYLSEWAGIISGSKTGLSDYNNQERVSFLIRKNETDDLMAFRNGPTPGSGGPKGIIADGLLGSSVKIMGSNFDGVNSIVRLNGTPSTPVASSGNFNFNLIGIGKRITQNYYTMGDYGEVIYFKSSLNEAQKIIIENYLQAKYNGAATGVLNIYKQDDIANGNYDHEVAGIGRVNASNLHDDSQGTGIVRILNPTDLDDDEFLFWGHDNGIQHAIETTDVPAGVGARFDRVWRVSEASSSGSSVDVGAIDIRFDLSELLPVTASDLRLLIDTDNDGKFADETSISGATSVGSDVYAFTGITAISDNLRFTLGTINPFQTPLPIELLNFEVKAVNNNVQINWQTASETNNAYFTIEKSINGESWRKVDIINGGGNSTVRLSYSSIDKHPFTGTSYYRLKQTDFDGKSTYSKVISVNIDLFSNNNDIVIYPNPSETQIIIEGDPIEINQVDIYNTLGQNITNLVKIIYSNEGNIIVDLLQLKPGTYYVKTKSKTKIFSKL